MTETTALQWEIEQLVKTKLFPDEPSVVRSALRALYVSQPKLKRQMTIRAYTAGQVSLGKAAELLGVSHKEMKDILREEDVEIHLGPETKQELLRDAAQACRVTERTILALEEEIVLAAQGIASQRRVPLSTVLSELAERVATRQAKDETRRGEAIIVESYGEEQVVVIDAIDYLLLCAVAAYHTRSGHPPLISQPDTEPAGLSEAEVEQAVQKAGGSPQVRWDEVIAAYLDWQINQGRAAILLGLSSYDLDERFRRLGIPRRIGPATEQEAHSEVDTALELLS